MFTATLTKFLSKGPFYPVDVGLDGNCRTNWYLNMLYINNLVNTDKMVSVIK